MSESDAAQGRRAAVREIIARMVGAASAPTGTLGAAAPRDGALTCALAIQEAMGYVPQESIREIAAALSVPEAQVSGSLAFYPDIHRKPTGRHHVRVCRGESCMANRAEPVVRALERALAVPLGDTTADGRFTLNSVYCVGNCAVSPTVMVDDCVHGRVTPDSVAALLDQYR